MIAFFLIAVPVFLIHLLESTLLFRAGPIFSRIDFLLLYLAFAAFPRGASRGAAIGAAIGLFRDVATHGSIGPGVLAFGAAGWFAGWSHRKLVGESQVGLLLILFGSVLVHDLVRTAASAAHGFSSSAMRVLLVTIPTGILTALTGALIREARARLRRPVEVNS